MTITQTRQGQLFPYQPQVDTPFSYSVINDVWKVQGEKSVLYVLLCIVVEDVRSNQKEILDLVKQVQSALNPKNPDVPVTANQIVRAKYSSNKLYIPLYVPYSTVTLSASESSYIHAPSPEYSEILDDTPVMLNSPTDGFCCLVKNTQGEYRYQPMTYTGHIFVMPMKCFPVKTLYKYTGTSDIDIFNDYEQIRENILRYMCFKVLACMYSHDKNFKGEPTIINECSTALSSTIYSLHNKYVPITEQYVNPISDYLDEYGTEEKFVYKLFYMFAEHFVLNLITLR